MRGFFPHLMAGCDCQHFLQAILDISSAWARHTRTPRGGDARVSLADFQPSATWASPLVLLSRPAQTTAAAQRLDTLNETSAPSREFSERAAAMRAPFALSLGGEEPTRTSTTPNQFPAPTNESLVVAAPALSALVANAGDEVDAALQRLELVEMQPFHNYGGRDCPLDAVLLWGDDNDVAAVRGSGGGDHDEAWLDDDHCCRGYAESGLWPASESEDDYDG